MVQHCNEKEVADNDDYRLLLLDRCSRKYCLFIKLLSDRDSFKDVVQRQ